MEIRLVGAVLMHADRWTDGHDRALYYYANVPNNDTMKYCNPRSVPPPQKKIALRYFSGCFHVHHNHLFRTAAVMPVCDADKHQGQFIYKHMYIQCSCCVTLSCT